MKRLFATVAVLIAAGCKHRQPAAVVPPAPQAQPQARPPQRPAPAPRTPAPQATAQPIPLPQPQPRVTPDLQSRVDAAGNRTVVEARLRDVRSALDTLNRRTLTGTAKEDRDRVAAMLDLAQQAFNRGNLRQADDLSTRAAMLAKTLTDAR